MSVAETARAFIAAINAHDTARIAALMSENHVFVDSLGARIVGRAVMESGWRAYFELCPDYWVRIEREFTDGAEVALFGEAGGTIHGQKWCIPAAWLARTETDQVREWWVFADNKPVYDILAAQDEADSIDEQG